MVLNGRGTISGADVTNVTVRCSALAIPVDSRWALLVMALLLLGFGGYQLYPIRQDGRERRSRAVH
jgi:hypothetical protein